jgi:AraC family transcriptional regulator
MSATVHPVALARAHRRHFGCSITDRTRKRRVREAADLLGAPDESLSTVAFATGFSDQAHLTRVFKRETGTTPGRFRALLAS